jgi:hypothetical protein
VVQHFVVKKINEINEANIKNSGILFQKSKVLTIFKEIMIEILFKLKYSRN